MSFTTKRHILLAISIALLIASPIWLFYFEGNQATMLGSGFLRAGLVLGAIWLALPQVIQIRTRIPPRLIIALLVGLVVVIVRPKVFPIVALMILAVAALEFAGWILKPFSGNTRRKNPQ